MHRPSFVCVCFPPDLCREIDARAINIAARRILGVDRTARIGTLRFVAGTFSYRHLLVMHLAEQSDLVIRANNSGIQKGTITALCKAYNTKHLRPETLTIIIPVERILESEVSQTTERVWRGTTWKYVSYPTGWRDDAIREIGGANYSKEIRASLFRSEGTFQFEGTH